MQLYKELNAKHIDVECGRNIIVENSFFTWASSVWESVMVCLQIKLTIRLCVERLEKCHSYSMKNHEVGTKDQPMFLSETVSIMSLSFSMSIM